MNKKAGLVAVAVGATAIAIIGATFATEPPGVATEQNVASSTTDKPTITVYRNENCSCCKDWAEHLKESGFHVDLVVTNTMNDVKREHGVPREMQSCHTAVMDNLVIEGHVPAEDILAFQDNPVFNVEGLSVPGMVQGSPGMETGTKQDYAVIAFGANGLSSVYREYTDY
ncbi:DUF411 domain-containing protein [Marinobacter fonticola]|uniref:DUF411 domain-containing protein n=1 Tax=Marinobacter fonticola TaxID=2603215 RepID=UPI0011E71CFE|nr:DUF411 domain-containing protein [Marinobacter fonticola]